MSFLPESEEIVAHRLIARDFGPDLAVILPREHWLMLGALVAYVREQFEGQSDEPVSVALDEMRELAAHAIQRALGDSFLADRRAGFQ